jgi:hypothetical protein
MDSEVGWIIVLAAGAGIILALFGLVVLAWVNHFEDGR